MPDSLNVNNKSVGQNNYDAIVIGSGISGGWAAKELCEKGLKTLVLERGRNVEHIKDYPTALTPPWGFEHRDELTLKLREENPIAARCYAFNEATEHFFVKDAEHPYVQTKPFDWISNPMRNRYNNKPRLTCDAAKPNQTNPFTCE